MRTYRLTITQTDLSNVQLADESTGFAGFTVAQAKRGDVEPIFIPQGNESYIIEQFGPPSASNSDVQEIIDFNRQHDIWVSAPAGVEDGFHVNRYGAVFVAEDGVYEGYSDSIGLESTANTREATFRVSRADTPGDTAIGNESDEEEPSQYIEFTIPGSESAPLKLDASSVYDAYFKRNDSRVQIRAKATDMTWDDRADTTITDAIPADSAVAYEDSWEYIIDSLDYSSDPSKFRFLKASDEAGVDGVINGFAYLVENGAVSDLKVRIYTAIYDGADLNPVYGEAAEDLMFPANDFYAYFAESATSKKRVRLEATAEIEAVAMFYQKFPTETTTSLDFLLPPRKDVSDNLLRVVVTDKPSKNISISERTYDVSLDPEAVDDYNASVFAEDIMNDRVVGVVVLGSEDDEPALLEDIAPFSASDFRVEKQLIGKRAVNHVDSDEDVMAAMQQGWDASQAVEFDQVAAFFAPRWLPGIDTALADVRATHRFSRCVTHVMPNTNEGDLETVVDDRSSLVNDHGLTYTFGEIRTRDARTDTAWWRFPVGAYTAMLVRIMQTANGAAAPMFTNGPGNVGGQIDASFEEVRIKHIPQDIQREIDEAGLNTIIYDPDYGLMMVNQRTAQNPAVINDASWLGHDMAFDLFKRNVYRNIQVPQLGKPINAQYTGLRTRQLQNLAARFSNAFNAVRVEVDSVNTDETRGQRRFQMATAVQVTPFSEFVDFNFYNVSQEASVDDPFEDA